MEARCMGTRRKYPAAEDGTHARRKDGCIEWGRGGPGVNACELTASITAAANALACKLSEDELNLLGVTLTQLGDTLLTIATQRSICGQDGK